MSNKEIDISVGPGFCGFLAILFIGLKLTGYITWSWWWVLSPIWIPVVVVLVVLVGFTLVCYFAEGRK